mmetsp:Transcript_76058/g.234793  ORF Transcript_76058/g.234793 Transcript_76058/m.234793 type:complete len:318 (+) Transcript_76058:2192-3145(+)
MLDCLIEITPLELRHGEQLQHGAQALRVPTLLEDVHRLPRKVRSLVRVVPREVHVEDVGQYVRKRRRVLHLLPAQTERLTGDPGCLVGVALHEPHAGDAVLDNRLCLLGSQVLGHPQCLVCRVQAGLRPQARKLSIHVGVRCSRLAPLVRQLPEERRRILSSLPRPLRGLLAVGNCDQGPCLPPLVRQRLEALDSRVGEGDCARWVLEERGVGGRERRNRLPLPVLRALRRLQRILRRLERLLVAADPKLALRQRHHADHLLVLRQGPQAILRGLECCRRPSCSQRILDLGGQRFHGGSRAREGGGCGNPTLPLQAA